MRSLYLWLRRLFNVHYDDPRYWAGKFHHLNNGGDDLTPSLESATNEQIEFAVKVCQQLAWDALAERNYVTPIGLIILNREKQMRVTLEDRKAKSAPVHGDWDGEAR